MTKAIVLLSLLFSFVFISCHKDKKDSPSGSDCKITSLSIGSVQNNFTYDANGRISTNAFSTFTNTFSYSGNTITEIQTTSGVFSYKNVITVNSDGLATNVRNYFDESGDNWANYAYEYNGTELAKETYTNSSGTNPSITTFTWQNGNLVSSQSTNVTTLFTYDTGEPSQTGDYFSLLALTQGYAVIRTKNRVKSFGSSADIISLAYTTDSDGKITTLTTTEMGNTQNITYQYQCK